jgi:hypothetical protein
MTPTSSSGAGRSSGKAMDSVITAVVGKYREVVDEVA